jgi:hypothetical protein
MKSSGTIHVGDGERCEDSRGRDPLEACRLVRAAELGDRSRELLEQLQRAVSGVAARRHELALVDGLPRDPLRANGSCVSLHVGHRRRRIQDLGQVRHAAIRVLGASRCPVGLPSDVYPVYWQIAAESGVTAVPFDTFPRFDIESILSGVAAAGVAVALLPAPLKLQGRRWTAEEAATACRWLAERPDRRLILDGVYSFGCELDEVLRRCSNALAC